MCLHTTQTIVGHPNTQKYISYIFSFQPHTDVGCLLLSMDLGIETPTWGFGSHTPELAEACLRQQDNQSWKGFLTNNCYGLKVGRPTDVEELPDGSIIVSDDYGGWYGGFITTSPLNLMKTLEMSQVWTNSEIIHANIDTGVRICF
eukprot:TRINITY_DN10466_c0_g1_i1.p1 TRINITY_DN10466_c0_g1~~TRINITY_DN10466_c0_g1_i1.p1  ORF type:complete len:146 (-),score=6.03 TRINITY_DN10466_c0_g1_i1:71-508(-)